MIRKEFPITNAAIRQRIRDSNLFLWQVAAAAGISEPQFFRWLRTEIPPEDERYKRIMTAIEKLERMGGKDGEEETQNTAVPDR